MDFGTDFRLGGNLTLVDSGVAGLHVFDLQHPLLGRVLEVRLKPFVGDERRSVQVDDGISDGSGGYGVGLKAILLSDIVYTISP